MGTEQRTGQYDRFCNNVMIVDNTRTMRDIAGILVTSYLSAGGTYFWRSKRRFATPG